MAVRRCVEDLCMAVHGCAWLCMAAHGCAWLCMAAHGCAEMCGGLVHGCAWLCMAVHGCAWLRMAARVGEEIFEDSLFPVGRKGLGDRK
jgi:hypothetical protein